MGWIPVLAVSATAGVATMVGCSVPITKIEMNATESRNFDMASRLFS
jgi:hypothetical protein